MRLTTIMAAIVLAAFVGTTTAPAASDAPHCFFNV